MGSVFFSEDCVICLDAASTRLFYPCRHACVCAACDEKILKAKMACPLCREKITARGPLGEDEEKEEQLIGAFVRKERDAYIRQLDIRVASNVCGNLGAFARQIFGDEYERRQAEAAGEARAMASKIEFAEHDHLLVVTYKSGRRKFTEKVPLVDADLGDDAEPLTVLDLATHSPAQYWAWYRAWDGDVERGLREGGLLQTKRRRKK
jgi:hypothetical protein